MNLFQTQQQLDLQLRNLYDEREAAAIADWVMEKITGLKKMDRLLGKNQPVSAPAQELLNKYTAELLMHRPVQYVLGESWFYKMKFYVDERVLIPRPETEELVEWLLAEAAGDQQQITGSGQLSILDVGTGSGCIAVALYKALNAARTKTADGVKTTGTTTAVGATTDTSAATILACDVSADALDVARRNADFHDASIDFRQMDFLDTGGWGDLPAVQFVISNPPYIPLKEQSTLARHVTGFEPPLALFVEDEDPLLFYRALATFSQKKFLPGGSLFVEIHEALATPTLQVFREAGASLITLKKDMQGRNRMIKATW